MPPPIRPEQRFRASIEAVGIGGYIGFERRTYRVNGTNTYERDGVQWPELVLFRLNDGTTQYLEWEKGDEISVYVSRATLSFEEVGLKGKEQLWEISRAEEGTVAYDGKTYRYHEDSAVTFFRDSGTAGTPFRQYLFANENRQEFVGVEEWGSEREGYEHNVMLSAYLDPGAIEVLVKGGTVD